MVNKLEGVETLQEAVYQTVGRGSVCWHEDGVFDEVEATKAADDLIDWIEDHHDRH